MKNGSIRQVELVRKCVFCQVTLATETIEVNTIGTETRMTVTRRNLETLQLVDTCPKSPESRHAFDPKDYYGI